MAPIRTALGQAAKDMLDQLAWWTNVLKATRGQAARSPHGRGRRF